MNEFGLTLAQVGRSLGRSPGTVSNLVSLLKLSDRILEFIEGGRLGGTHGTALLKAKNPEARQALALAAVRERWTLRELEDRVRASNVDLLESLQGRGEQARNAGQARELAAVNLARSWGDLLGAEVQVRPMSRRKLRLEVAFDFPAEGIALADRLAAAIARSSKGR